MAKIECMPAVLLFGERTFFCSSLDYGKVLNLQIYISASRKEEKSSHYA